MDISFCKFKNDKNGQKEIKLDESKLSSPTTFCIDNIISGYKLLQILKWLWNGCFFLLSSFDKGGCKKVVRKVIGYVYILALGSLEIKSSKATKSIFVLL